MDRRNPLRTTELDVMVETMMFLGIYRGIIIPGVPRWCKMLFIDTTRVDSICTASSAKPETQCVNVYLHNSLACFRSENLLKSLDPRNSNSKLGFPKKKPRVGGFPVLRGGSFSGSRSTDNLAERRSPKPRVSRDRSAPRIAHACSQKSNFLERPVLTSQDRRFDPIDFSIFGTTSRDPNPMTLNYLGDMTFSQIPVAYLVGDPGNHPVQLRVLGGFWLV